MQRIRGKGGPGGAQAGNAGMEAKKFLLEDPEDKLVGQTVLERYQIISKMGQGGMGGVYQAFDMKEKRTVAFKVISEELAARPEMLARFRREAKALAMINHPNVVEVWDMAHFGNKAYITMEFLKGTDLGGVLRPGKGRPSAPLSWERAQPLMLQICEALEAAHKNGILHRDLKPANIFVIRRDGAEFVKVLDFGLAKFDEDKEGPGHETQLTQTGYFLGTPSYGSPEQAMGKKDYDHRADIYSLGVVMFELLTARVPFKGENARQTFQMIINDPTPSPRALNPAIPADVEEVIFRAMAKNPGDRFQDIREMRDAIARSRPGRGDSTDRSDEFNRGAYDDSTEDGLRPHSISGPDLGEEAPTESDDAAYAEPRKGGALGRMIKGAIIAGAIGTVAVLGYQHRSSIMQYVKDAQSARPAPTGSAPRIQPVPSSVETGRHIDVLVMPNNLQVFTANRPGHTGRYLGTTPLTNVRLEEWENELVIWKQGRSMSVRLGPDQGSVTGTFRAGGGGAVRARPSADRTQPGNADEAPAQDTAPVEQENQ